MTIPPPSAVYSAARPIGVLEFLDALRATCPPRSSQYASLPARPVALGISGGVDSMALAYLCSQLVKTRARFSVGNSQFTGYFMPIIIDHDVREGSLQEAKNVAKELERIGIRKAEIRTINWESYMRRRHSHTTPQEMPNFETVARELRYNLIARTAKERSIHSLFLAHHEDDQYETVLMRFLQGHLCPGLRGIPKANDIPGVHGHHGLYRSGFIETSKTKSTRSAFGDQHVTNSHAKTLRRQLSNLHSSITAHMENENENENDLYEDEDEELEAGNDGLGRLVHHQNSSQYQIKKHTASHACDIDVEDGGMFMYRPLLEFSKDRLRATCEANDVNWFEDHTNKDPTVTMRNAVRHLWQGHNLPRALQKPAILTLSKRCDQRLQVLHKEAIKLLHRFILHDMDTRIGTLTVQFPNLTPPKDRRPGFSARLRRAHRLDRERQVADVALSKAVSLVSNESEGTYLLNHPDDPVSRIFPGLAKSVDVANTLKPFHAIGLYFTPVKERRQGDNDETATSEEQVISSSYSHTQAIRWFISRAPYAGNATQPVRPPPLVIHGGINYPPIPAPPGPFLSFPHWAKEPPHTPVWQITHLEDPTLNQKTTVIKRDCYLWCPWTPWKLWDNRWWFQLSYRTPFRVFMAPLDAMHIKRFRKSLPESEGRHLLKLLHQHAPGRTRWTIPALYIDDRFDMERANRDAEQGISPVHEYNEQQQIINSLKILALPTLGISITGVENWVKWQVRYKRIDFPILDALNQPAPPPDLWKEGTGTGTGTGTTNNDYGTRSIERWYASLGLRTAASPNSFVEPGTFPSLHAFGRMSPEELKREQRKKEKKKERKEKEKGKKKYD